MIKKILLPLENSPYTNSALDYACFVAKRQDAVVTGGIFLDVEKINKSLGTIDKNFNIKWNNKIDPETIANAKPTLEFLIHAFISKCENQKVKFNLKKRLECRVQISRPY